MALLLNYKFAIINPEMTVDKKIFSQLILQQECTIISGDGLILMIFFP